MNTLTRRLLVLAAFFALLAGCGGSPSGQPQGAAGPVKAAMASSGAGIELRRGKDPRELVRIGTRGVVIGPEGGRLEWKFFEEPRRADDAWYLLRTYGPFHAVTAEGEIHFRGRGRVKPGPVERRMILDWTRQVAAEAAGGRSGAAYGLVLAGHQGASSGICEDVALYLTGEAVATACGWPDEARGRLDPAQLARVYAWFDRLQPFQTHGAVEENARAGALETRMIFAGRGPSPASPQQQMEIQGFALRLFAELEARHTGNAPAPPPPPAAPGTPAARTVAPEAAEAPPTARLLLPPPAMSPREEPIPLRFPETPPAPPPSRGTASPSAPRAAGPRPQAPEARGNPFPQGG
ncbi:MAG: hypothetical protein ACJ75H_21040 [Thermoanaerobaculia bacterium]